jgi:hypothetical protein
MLKKNAINNVKLAVSDVTWQPLHDNYRKSGGRQKSTRNCIVLKNEKAKNTNSRFRT